MRLIKSCTATLLATAAGFGAVGVAEAQAVEYAHHVGIGSGGNYFGPFVRLYDSEVVGYGQGIGCAGIRGISGVVCEGGAGQDAQDVLSY